MSEIGEQNMQMQTEHADRLAKLAARMAQASAKAAEAQKDLRAAERRSERADAAVTALREEYDLERINLWGQNPDVQALLATGGSMAFYYAGEALAESHGLGWGNAWGDTHQTVLHLRLNRGEAGAIERAEAAVLFFAPHIKAVKGWKRFGVHHREMDQFALELRYSPSRGTAQIVRMHMGMEDGKESFGTLRDALQCIHDRHWIEDIFELGHNLTLLE